MDELIHSPNQQTWKNKNKKPKRLPCGHILHLSCLKNWMERSQTCPICRLPVFDEKGNVVQTTFTSNSDITTQTTVTDSTGIATDQQGFANEVDLLPTRTTPPDIRIVPTQNIDTLAVRTTSTSTPSPTWYTFPLHKTGDNSVGSSRSAYEFLITNSDEKENGIPVKLTIENHEVNSLHGDGGEQIAKKIVIPDKFIQHI